MSTSPDRRQPAVPASSPPDESLHASSSHPTDDDMSSMQDVRRRYQALTKTLGQARDTRTLNDHAHKPLLLTGKSKRKLSTRISYFVRRLLGFVLLFLAAGSIAYFIVNGLLQYYDVQLHGYVQQLLTLLTMILMLFVLFFATRLVLVMLHRDPDQIWREMKDAIQRIGSGDFQIALDTEQRYDGVFGEVVQMMNVMARNLQQMELLRQEFISNVSHEIQSPFTSLRGFAIALQNEQLTPEERRHYLSIIETESARLSRLSDNLLKLTSLESEQYPFERRTYRLDAQIQHLVLACEPQWLDKQLDLELDLQTVTLEADEDLLNQVWSNLIQNAIKFTPEYGSLHIALTQEQMVIGNIETDIAVVTITDSGPGIAEEDLPRVFERFYKGDKSRTRTAGGSGLGLSIVKKAVEMHGGTVIASTRTEGGAQFCVKLPLLMPPIKKVL
ncbi:sensor histidine kinase [Paenibacillus kandeliae]|uniref:sensor histidine kinase n=1 Tax=Paenibacillus kandeliae TaxID=3231269 RepID=UPI00345B2017